MRLYANGVTFHSPGSPRQRRTLGTTPRACEYPNGVSQTRAARVPIVYPLPTQRGRRTFVQPRWGNRAALSRGTQGTRHGREPWAMEYNAVGVRAIGRINR